MVREAAPSQTPAVLSRLYPSLKTLASTIIDITGQPQLQEQLKATLVQPGDPAGYTGLLTQGMAATNPGALPLREGLTLQQQSTQTELLNRAIETLVRAVQGEANVLSLGFRKRRPSTSAFYLQGMHNAEAYYPNTTTKSLRDGPWPLLLSRIGDSLMLYLLMHVSIFLPLANGCYLQVAGTPIGKVVWHQKRNKTAAGNQASASMHQRPQQRQQQLQLQRHRQSSAAGAPATITNNGSVPSARAADASPPSPITQDVTGDAEQCMDWEDEVEGPANRESCDLPAPLQLVLVHHEQAAHAAQQPSVTERHHGDAPTQGGIGASAGNGIAGDQPKLSGTAVGVAEPVAGSRSQAQRAARPSSWQRRKAAKQRQAMLIDNSALVTNAARSGVGARSTARVPHNPHSSCQQPANASEHEAATGTQVTMMSARSRGEPSASHRHRHPAAAEQCNQQSVHEAGPSTVGDLVASVQQLDVQTDSVAACQQPGGSQHSLPHNMQRMPSAAAAGLRAASSQPQPATAQPATSHMHTRVREVAIAQERAPSPCSAQLVKAGLQREPATGCTATYAGPLEVQQHLDPLLAQKDGADQWGTQALTDSPMELWDFSSQPDLPADPGNEPEDAFTEEMAAVDPSLHATLPAAVPRDASDIAAQHAQRADGPAGPSCPAGGNVQQQCKPRKGWTSPSDMLLPRASILYCSSFGRQPGLPSQHILRALHGKQDAARILYASIFLPGAPKAKHAWNQACAPLTQLPPAPKRIQKQHRQLLRPLQRMLGREQKCPYGRLLNHHCPLPDAFKRPQQQYSPPAGPALQLSDRAIDRGLKPAAASQLPDTTLATMPPPAPRLQQLPNTLASGPCQLAPVSDMAEDGGPQPAHAAQLPDSPMSGTSASLMTQGGSIRSPGRSQGCRDDANEMVMWDAAMECDASSQPPDGSAGPTVGLDQHLASQEPAEQIITGKAAAAQDADLTADPADDDMAAGPAEADMAAEPANAALSASPSAMQAEPCQRPDCSLIQAFVPHAKVTAFVWSVVRHLVPKELLGSKPCQRALRRSIHSFVGLRRYEQMSVHQAMQGLPVSGLPAFQAPAPTGSTVAAGRTSVPASQAAAQQRMVALWVKWLMGSLVVPLIRAHFYCTETQAYRQQVFYYRKPVWVRLRQQTMGELREFLYRPMTNRQAQQCLQARQLGVATLRLLPKRTGMRPIANLGKSSVVVFRGAPAQRVGSKRGRRTRAKLLFKPVNTILQNVYQVLKHEAHAQPLSLGGSVFSYNDAYRRLHPFLRHWRAAAEASGTAPTAYIVSVDVAKAFDNVNVEKLLSIVELLLQRPDYLVVKYAEVMPSLSTVRNAYRRVATNAAGAFAGFPQYAASMAREHSQRVFTDQVVYQKVERGSVVGLLREHVRRNLVRIGRQWHYQAQGIPQGSTLSSILCSLFLAHLEAAHLIPLMPRNALVHRPGASQASASTFGLTGLAHAAGSSDAHGSPAGMPSSADDQPAAGVHTQSRPGSQDAQLGTGVPWGGLPAAPTGACSPQDHAVGLDRTHSPGHLPSSQQIRSQEAMSSQGGSAFSASFSQPGSASQAQHDRQEAGLAGHAMPQPGHPGCSHPAADRGAGRAADRHAHNRLPSLLIRLIDDFLFITPSRSAAEALALRLLQGFPDYGISINPAKTRLNLDLHIGGRALERNEYHTADGCAFIRWCGLLINTRTLEMQADYTRYVGEHLASTLTLPLVKNAGQQLAAKLCAYMRPKCHPLLIDTTINSAATVRLNIYQAFLLAAMKFHCHVASMPMGPAGDARPFYTVIYTALNYMSALVRKRVQSARRRLHMDCRCCISHCQIKWLGLHAFRKVLGKKQSSYRLLLKRLDGDLAAPGFRHLASHLASVVDPCRSSTFDNILY